MVFLTFIHFVQKKTILLLEYSLFFRLMCKKLSSTTNEKNYNYGTAILIPTPYSNINPTELLWDERQMRKTCPTSRTAKWKNTF